MAFVPASAIAAGLPAQPARSTAAPSGASDDKTEIAFEIGVQHDSNTARGSAARAALRGLQPADEYVTPLLSVNLARAIGRTRFGIKAALGYDFYRRNTQLNRERVALAPFATIDAADCNLAVNPTISRRQSDLAYIAAIDNGTTVVPRSVTNAETVFSFGGRLSCGGVGGLRPYLSASRTIANNSELRRSISEYRSTSYGAGLSYETRFAGVVSVNYNHLKNDYNNRPLANGARDGYTLNAIGLRLERPILSRLTGEVGASFTELKPRRAGVVGFKSVTWDIGLTGTIGANLQVHAAFSRAVQPSLLTDSIYHIDRTYVLDATYAFNELLTVKLGASTKPRSYAGAGTAFGPALTNDRRDEVFATASYAPTKRTKLLIDTGYQRRRANADIYNYSNFYVGFRTQFTL